ncbi:MAG: hypothetical protein AC479_02695 [miscellaneous Crenarchaeota group-6 archaeon AD8-1]|nr:MAG: hypothetical protein AC479_02695 [miscellaneous Crenarchaeota group-6 archaeon AD8-1]
MTVSGKTKIYGVIGDPIEHSLSPTIQNSAFQYFNLDFIFLAFNVKNEELKNFIKCTRSFGIQGLNVTMPHKENVIRYLDEIDDNARFLNSVNTIVNNKGRLFGYTTDGIGAVCALKENNVDLASSKVVLLGAGGAGRAIALSLADKVANLVILNRDLEKAKRLYIKLKQKFNRNIFGGSLSEDSIKKHLENSDVLINATNVGMKPNQTESIIDSSMLSSNLTVMDIVYNPIETKLLVDAKRIGANIINGIEMLIYQGAASFELWSGKKAPIDVMKKAAIKKILTTGEAN